MIEGAELINRILSAHASFNSFRCRAILRRRICAESEIDSLFEMRLAFSRPANMFLQWWSGNRPETKHRVMLASSGRVIDHSFADMEWKQAESIEDVLASYAGISSGLSLHVPSLLIGSKDHTLFERLESVSRTSEENCESYLLTGVGSAEVRRSVRVRAADFVIQGMTERFTIPNGTVECESEYTDITVNL